MTHTERKLILQAQTRHGRRKHGVFLAEGLRCCREGLTRRAAAAKLVLGSREFADSAEFAGIQELAARAGLAVELLAEHEFAAFAATENPQGILCLFREFPPPPPLENRTDPFVLILDRVADPGNLGTILRTAWAVGLTEVWLTEGTTDPFGPKAIRAGMGAQFALVLREFPGLAEVHDELRRLGCARLWCSMPRGGVSCFAPEFDLAGSGLVIGNEAGGILGVCRTSQSADSNTRVPTDSEQPVEYEQKPCTNTECDRLLVTIPMPGQAESLNAAQATTILLFEAVRRGLLAAQNSEQ